MLFLLAALSTLALIYGYVGWRTIAPAPWPRRWKRRLWVLPTLFCVLAPLPLFLLRLGGGGPKTDALSWVGFVGLGFFTLAFFTLVAADGLRLVARLGVGVTSGVRRLAGGLWGGAAPRYRPTDFGRRRVLTFPVNLGLLGVTGALTGYGAREALREPRVVRVRVPLPHLPPALEGFRMVQLTDIHLGSLIKGDFLGAIVDRTNALEPDLIAVTGDLVDGTVPYLKRAIAPLAALSARQGVFFVTGNHEYYSGAEPWIEEIDRLGATVLLNEHRVVRRGGARLLLAGVTDPQGGQYVAGHTPDLAKAVSGGAPADLKVLLAHQPQAIFGAAGAGFDLQLSGHTHGGQFFPFSLLVDLAQPYLKGLHRHENTWIYVSQGTGFWGPPLRVGTQAEITLIELVARI